MAGADFVGPENPLPPPRRMPWWQRAIRMAVIAVLVALAVAVPVYLLAPPVGQISGHALQWSVARELYVATSFGFEPCEKRGAAWDCAVWYDVGSGMVDYRVTREGRCWDARIRGDAREFAMPATAHGCVGLRDQIRLVQRIGL